MIEPVILKDAIHYAVVSAAALRHPRYTRWFAMVSASMIVKVVQPQRIEHTLNASVRWRQLG